MAERAIPDVSGPGADLVADLEHEQARLASRAIAQMEAQLDWYGALPAETRSVVGLVAQAGIAAFIGWCRDPSVVPSPTADVFGSAPREVAREVSLRQTVELVRATVDVVEEYADGLADPARRALLRDAVLRYSREVAFAAAEVYAQAAETRGAWDARLEAFVVDGVVRGEDADTLRSRAAAIGWGPNRPTLVVVGGAPTDPETDVARLRREARLAHTDVLIGTHGDRLIVIAAGSGNLPASVERMADCFGPGPLVIGPVTTGIGDAGASARAALAGHRVAPAWPGAPRPVSADDLLPERAYVGDRAARAQLVEDVYRPLAAAPTILATVSAFLEETMTVEATARALFVHPNTVRYRLRRCAELCGHLPSQPRGAATIRAALLVGRLAEP